MKTMLETFKILETKGFRRILYPAVSEPIYAFTNERFLVKVTQNSTKSVKLLNRKGKK